jgi:hypothetical protein
MLLNCQLQHRTIFMTYEWVCYYRVPVIATEHLIVIIMHCHQQYQNCCLTWTWTDNYRRIYTVYLYDSCIMFFISCPSYSSRLLYVSIMHWLLPLASVMHWQQQNTCMPCTDSFSNRTAACQHKRVPVIQQKKAKQHGSQLYSMAVWPF